jgi:hypothetical protein
MPKRAKEKTALEVKGLLTPGFHSVGHVAGLHLRVKPSGARSWMLRATVGGNTAARSRRRCGCDYATAQSLESNSACSNTVSVAFSCLSGG